MGAGAADRAWARVGLGSGARSGTGLLAEEECISVKEKIEVFTTPNQDDKQ